MCCLNNNFYCLNNTTSIHMIIFHPHVFSQHLNNIAKITLPNDPNGLTFQVHLLTDDL